MNCPPCVVIIGIIFFWCRHYRWTVILAVGLIIETSYLEYICTFVTGICTWNNRSIWHIFNSSHFSFFPDLPLLSSNFTQICIGTRPTQYNTNKITMTYILKFRDFFFNLSYLSHRNLYLSKLLHMDVRFMLHWPNLPKYQMSSGPRGPFIPEKSCWTKPCKLSTSWSLLGTYWHLCYGYPPLSYVMLCAVRLV